MMRMRMVGTLLAVVLLAAACGEDAVIVGDLQDGAEAPGTTAARPDESPEASGPAEPDAAEPDDEPDAAGSGSEGADDAAPTGDGADDAVPTGDGAGTAPVDAETLLASAIAQFADPAVRGVSTVELAPGFEVSMAFESDAEGDLAATFELPPGMDPEFTGGSTIEVRYVGGVAYVRPPVPPEVLAELGVDEAWYVDEQLMAVDPMGQDMGLAGGIMCLPQSFEDCDPMGDTSALLEAASGAEIVGREDVGGVTTTRVRFLVSLLDLAGEALGTEPGEGGAFDDTASDPFAEGLDQIFSFLDADFEVEVWINDESRIRRLSLDMSAIFASLVDPNAAAEMPSSLVTVEYHDFDADISVEAPPPGLIFDVGLILGDDALAFEELDDDYDETYDEASESGQ